MTNDPFTNSGASRRNRMRKAVAELEVPRYPHVRVVELRSGRLMVQLNWGKPREATILGNRITCVGGRSANSYGVYEGELSTGSFETKPENIEVIKWWKKRESAPDAEGLGKPSPK